MWKLAMAGFASLIAGALKFADHLNRPATFEDYLVFRCGPAGLGADSGTLGHIASAVGHCWGCYAMAAGAGMMAVSIWCWTARSRAGSKARP